MFHKPSVLELSCTVILREYAVYFNAIANNGLSFHLVVTNGTVFAVKTVNKNGLALSVFNVNITVGAAFVSIEARNFTANVIFLRRCCGKILTDFQCLGNRKGSAVFRKSGSDGDLHFFRLRNVAAGNGCFKDNFRSVGNVCKRHLAAFDGNEFAIAYPRNHCFGVHSATFGKFYFRIALIGVLQAKRLDGVCHFIRCGNRRSINKTDKMTNVRAVLTKVRSRNRTADAIFRVVVTKIEFVFFARFAECFRNDCAVLFTPIEFRDRGSIRKDVVVFFVSTYAHANIIFNVFLHFARFCVNNVFLEVKIKVCFAVFNIFCVNINCFFRIFGRAEIVVIIFRVAVEIQVFAQGGLIYVELVRRIFQRFTRNRSGYVLTYRFYGKSEVLRRGLTVRCRNRSRKNVVYVNGGSFVYVYFRNVAVAFQFNAVYVNAPRKGVVKTLYVRNYVYNVEIHVVVRIYFLLVHSFQNSLNSLKVDYRCFRFLTFGRTAFTRNPAFARDAAFARSPAAGNTVFIRSSVVKTAAKACKTGERSNDADELFLHEFLLMILI